MSIIKHVTLQKIVAHDFRYDPHMLVTDVLFFTAEELQALKEEFNHHQDKIDQYLSLLRDVEEGPNDTHQSKRTCHKECKDHLSISDQLSCI